MAASLLNLLIEQNATFRQRITWQTGSPLAPVNLTGYTAKMQLRANLADATPLLELNTTNGGITLGGAAGTIDLYIAATATALLAVQSALYDLDLTAPNGGDTTRLVRGTIAISPAVTR